VEGGKDSGKKHTDRSRVFVASRPDWGSDSKWTKNNVKPLRNRVVSAGEGLCDEFPFDVEAILAVGVDVRLARRRQMHHITIIDVMVFRSELI
jgi:hypothetical protein